MIHLDLPKEMPSFSEVIDLCCTKDVAYKQSVLNGKSFLLQEAEIYKNLAMNNDLFLFDTTLPKNEIIFGDLRNEHMVRLYKYCLRKCRCGDIYDTIINLAQSVKCPFCGGIGRPTQIDHFLPQGRYGHFSVFPENLIPICKDCNTEYKKEFFPTQKDKQLIHPYLDDHAIFEEQWLYAEYIDDDSNIGSVKYYVSPPEKWTNERKEKVKFHFETFYLSARFSEVATGSLSDLLTQMQTYKNEGKITIEDFEISSIDSVINREKRANSWKKALFLAVKEKLPIIWRKI
ncbi:HNH endonuclease [Bisgaard Taxon 10/6]|uniref:HNH endonuclease n=1 Tax=Exercitatus varius TaxID=67857 RepID=UPI00294ABDA8|nr:HNH endonuclease [Exercitatus varius]MDG2955594.1 HNH endonuclease [Exercitatus varius]MDG2957680.1 HNH endonuclease [Exercitatus varius]MDG2962586.1 HNH endonuclease [Exercitatus varius]MDG2963874.1 HNH endonuclease [Exercitatus varius]